MVRPVRISEAAEAKRLVGRRLTVLGVDTGRPVRVSGSILAVKVQGEQAGSVWYGDADEQGESHDEEGPGELQRRLRFCAASWDELLQGLQPSGWDADEQAEEELLRQMQIGF